nr:AAA family ATPase [Candidatus Krumholzibacteria bacterium]
MNDSQFSAPAHLTESAEFLLRSILEDSPYDQGAPPHIDWWIMALLAKRGPMAQDLNPGLDVENLVETLRLRLQDSEGMPTVPVESLVERACSIARARGKEKASDRDVLKAVLEYLQNPAATTTPARETAAPFFAAKQQRPIPTLEKFGEDLTRLAAKGKLTPVLGREDEIRQVMETLCRAKKRNPALVGPAGVGKTAIVEGLAQRIVSGDVPGPLQGCRLFSLPASSMVAGANLVGDMEKRMTALLEEAGQNGILLLIDEVHSIMGAGGSQGRNDIASLLKPALARGDIACIVATTDVEYRKYITRDTALERRFNPVSVNEVSPAVTLEILKAFRDSLAARRSVVVGDEVLESLIRMAGRFIRNRLFPDKALDLLDHCVASAMTQGKKEVTPGEARAIVQKRVGMPLDTVSGIKDLEKRAQAENFLTAADLADIIYRLQTTTEDMDLAPREPNLSLLLHGEAAGVAGNLALAIAQSVFGAVNRVVRVDFSSWSQDNHINALVGSPAGYVGHGDPLPHDPVQQTPWCVVLWENIHLCHPNMRALLAKIMQSGKLVDNRGRATYFSDVVIIATAGSGRAPGPSTTSIGFEVEDGAPGSNHHHARALEEEVGEVLFGQFDLVISQAGARSTAGPMWKQKNLLKITAQRYASRGLEIEWDDTFVKWMTDFHEHPTELRDWEGLLDEHVNPVLRNLLRGNKIDRPAKVIVRNQDGDVIIEPAKTGGE